MSPAFLRSIGNAVRISREFTVTVLRAVKTLDKRVAVFTTRFLLTVIGGCAVIAFACTLKVFFFVVFLLFSGMLWISVYTFFLNLKQRRNGQ